MNHTSPGLLMAAGRLRLLLILAGLAWVLGIHPPVALRLLSVGLVVLGLALDYLGDRGLAPGPIRVTGYGRPGGDRP